nr:MAG TPA: hypothetical protein [Crassvirales sp.]DAR74778.1 MAG TPA: hypothetical protein [Crassvirales sp.]
MEEELTLDNIITDSDDISGFLDLDDLEGLGPSEEGEEKEESNNTQTKKEKSEETTEEEDETLSEEVGSEDGEEESEPKGKTSQQNFYSSIATALKGEGILPDLSDENIEKITDAEALAKSIQDHIESKLDETQKRINKALNDGVEPNTIKNYENTLKYLDSISDEVLSDESEQGVELRKRLIISDWINKGMKQERAIKLAEQSISNGTDLDDAKEALEGNKSFYQDNYNKILKDAENQRIQAQKDREQQAANLKKSILEDDKVFGDFEVDKATRQKVFDLISKPVHKDSETGALSTELQYYQSQNPTDFLKYVGLAYTLTNGFKNIGNLLQNKVKKEVKKGFKTLEGKIATTSRDGDGNLNFFGGGDSNSYDGLNFDFDV